MITEIGERIEFHRFLVKWWPLYRCRSCAGCPIRPAKAAGKSSPPRIDPAKSWANVTEWTVADIALIDELRVLSGIARTAEPPTRRTADLESTTSRLNVVVDEAQTLR